MTVIGLGQNKITVLILFTGGARLEGTKLVLTKDRMSVFGPMKVFESSYYKVQVVYWGDLPKEGENKEFIYNPREIKVTVTPKSAKAPELEFLPGSKDRKPYAGIEDTLPISFDKIDEYRTKLLVGKETIEEIDRVIRENYPNVCIIEK